jgi:Flp pilus assembly secretin CpaC
MIPAFALSALFALSPLAANAQGVPQSELKGTPALAMDPRGEGVPDAVTCRVPQALPGLRVRGPLVCQTNRVWKALAAHNNVILPDGKTLVATGLQSDACNSERIAGITPLIRQGNTRTFYRCKF